MAGMALTTDLSRASAMAAAVQAAQLLGFEVCQLANHQFRAKLASLCRSWLLPPKTPYCNFLVTGKKLDSGFTELILERNAPWWTGYAGIRGVGAMFDRLSGAVEDAVIAE